MQRGVPGWMALAVIMLAATMLQCVDAGERADWTTETMTLRKDYPDFAEYFGRAVALDEARDTLFVGAPQASHPFSGSSLGGVVQFRRDREAATWLQHTIHYPTPGMMQGQGEALALENDTLVIGTYGSSESFPGTVLVMMRNDTADLHSWAVEATLQASDGFAVDLFGCNVAISRDHIVVGCCECNAGSGNHTVENAGAVYVYARTAARSWREVAKLSAEDAASGSFFGEFIGVYGDMVFVGFPDHNSGQGAVFVYARAPVTESWSLVATLTPDGTPLPGATRFGCSISVSERVLVIGADGGTGAVFVYRRSSQHSNQWSVSETIVAPHPASGDFFGSAVTLSKDASRVVIGAPDMQQDGEPVGVGHALVFTYSSQSSTWILDVILDGDATYVDENDRFGAAVAIDGSHVVVAAPSAEDSSFEHDEGMVMIFNELACPSGQSANSTGYCEFCLTGEAVLGSPCSCAANEYLDDFHTDCEFCSAALPGSVSSPAGATAASMCECAHDSWNNGTACVACPASSTAATGQAFGWNECQCPENMYMDDQQACAECPAGTSSRFGSRSADDCVCPGNQYRSAAGCTACPDDATSQAGSSSLQQCVCARGSYLDAATESCMTCPSTGTGTDVAATPIGAQSASECVACPAGSKQQGDQCVEIECPEAEVIAADGVTCEGCGSLMIVRDGACVTDSGAVAGITIGAVGVVGAGAAAAGFMMRQRRAAAADVPGTKA